MGEYPNDDKTFEGWLSIVIPEDVLLVETAWRDVLRGNSYEIDFRVIQGGQIRWLRERAEPERGEAGDVIGAFGTLQDVTEKKKTVAALRASEERLRLALDAADMGVWEWNLQTGEFTWNKQTFRLLGYEPDAVVPSFDKWAQRIHPEDLPRLLDQAERMKNEPQEAYSQYRVYGRDNEVRWPETRGRYECDADGQPRRYYGVLTDITERKRAEERDRILTAEVNHRAKNLLAVVQAVALQTAKSANPKEFAQDFNERLAGLAASHDLLVQSEWRGVEIEALTRAQLAHFHSLIGLRIFLDGPSVLLKAAVSQTIGMAIHELGTNASKYGALSSPDGTVHVSWAIKDDVGAPRFEIKWLEQNGPAITAPSRRGFGQTLLIDMVEYSLDARAALSYQPSGLTWRMTAPIDQIIQTPEAIAY